MTYITAVRLMLLAQMRAEQKVAADRAQRDAEERGAGGNVRPADRATAPQATKTSRRSLWALMGDFIGRFKRRG